MALATLQDMVNRCRTLLQDTISPYRYTDDILVEALNMAVMEARRIRPDLMQSYFATSLPTFTSATMGATVSIEEMYKPAFVYYMVGHAQLTDDEDNQDARATVFINSFKSQLLTVA